MLDPDVVRALVQTRERIGLPMRFTRSGGTVWHPHGDAVPADSTSHASRSLHKYGLPDQPLGLAVDCDFFTASWQEAAAIFEAVLGLGIWRGAGFYPCWNTLGYHFDRRPADHSRSPAASPGRSGSRIPRPGATTTCRRPPRGSASCVRSRADGPVHRQPGRRRGGRRARVALQPLGEEPRLREGRARHPGRPGARPGATDLHLRAAGSGANRHYYSGIPYLGERHSPGFQLDKPPHRRPRHCLPNLPPVYGVKGLWAVAAIGTTEGSAAFMPWGAGGSAAGDERL